MVVKGNEPISHACVLLFREKKFIWGGLQSTSLSCGFLCHTRYQNRPTKIWGEARVYLAFSPTLESVDVIDVFSACSRPDFFLKVTISFSDCE